MAYQAIPTGGSRALTNLYAQRTPQLYETGANSMRTRLQFMLQKRQQLLDSLNQIKQERQIKKQQREAKKKQTTAAAAAIAGTVLTAGAGAAFLPAAIGVGALQGGVLGAGLGSSIGGGIGSFVQGDPAAGAETIARGTGQFLGGLETYRQNPFVDPFWNGNDAGDYGGYAALPPNGVFGGNGPARPNYTSPRRSDPASRFDSSFGFGGFDEGGF